MKTKIKTLLGAALSLLVTLGFTHSAAAQTDRIVFYTKVIATNVSKKGAVSYTTNREVMTMTVDGSDVGQLTAGAQDSIHPSWRPGKTHILFVREGTLYVMDTNGAGTFAVATVIPG